MSTKDDVKAMLIKGGTLNEVFAAFPNYTQSTLRTYVARSIAALTDAERKERDAARSARPRQRALNHTKYQDRQTMGPLHVRIGLKLLEVRMNLKMKSDEFCQEHDFANRAKLSLMEQGYHDFTVSEVAKIAELLGVTVEQLIISADNRA